jgi:hypothetical protein
MSPTTLAAPSRVELDLMLRAALLQASPAEVGRQRARRISHGAVLGLASLAALVTTYDLALLLGA